MATGRPTIEADPSRSALEALLAAVRRRTRLWIWAESLAIAVAVALVGGWLTLLVDRLIEPPAGVRLTLLAAVAIAVAWVLVTRLAMRLAVPLPDESLALVVERAHPELGAALSTAVSCGRRDDEVVDPDLLAATVSAAAAHVERIRVGTVFRRRRLAALVAAAAAAVGCTAAVAAVRPGEASLWTRRMLGLTDAPWPRRVTLEPEGFTAGRRVVARGDEVDVVVRATAGWGPPPEMVELRTRSRGRVRSERMGGRGGATGSTQTFGHVLEAIDGDLDLEIRGGDARLRGLQIAVEDPPAVAAVGIVVTPPAYLSGGPRAVAASRTVPVPRGSVVRLTVTSSKPLAAATVTLRSAAVTAEPEPAERSIASLEGTSAGSTTITATTPPLDADAAVLVRLVDDHHLVNRDPVAVLLVAVPDESPQVAVRLAGISSAVTPDAILPIEGELGDDHGLASAEVRLTAGDASRVASIPRVVAGLAEVDFPPDRPELVPLGPLGLAVGTRLEVSVAARDQCTLADGPHEAVGETWILDVVSPEALRALLEAREVLLRRRLEAVIDDLAKARDHVAADGSRPADAPRQADDSRRDEAAEPSAGDADVLRRGGAAAARAAGETAEIAGEFRGIHRELATNGLATPDIESRLLGQIAAPLAAIADEELTAVGQQCRAPAGDAARAAVVGAIDAAVTRLRVVLGRMLESESVNEVIERLRGVIRLQEEIRADTLDRQRRRGREALESP